MPVTVRKVAILLCLCGVAASGQHDPFDVTSIPTGIVSAVAQDRDGFLWLGGSVLYRFDGARLIAVPVGGISYAVAATPDGAVWVASQGGIFRVRDFAA